MLLLLERTAGVTGERFLEELARALADIASAQYAFVGEVEGGVRVRTLTHLQQGSVVAGFSYELADTPCWEVLNTDTCFYPKNVAAHFPKDQLLVDMGIESYAGIPLVGGSGTNLGILVALGTGPMVDLGDLRPVLKLFGARAGAEIERLRQARELERRQLQSVSLHHQLAASEARYRQMIMTCSEGVWSIDVDGRTALVNPQMARMLGYTASEVQGRLLIEFMDDRARHDYEVNLTRWREGTTETREFRFKHAKGHDVWVLLATNPLYDEAESYAGTQAFVTDVTERRGLELKVQHAQKLESLGVLAGGIAHDFNNLLVGILGNVGLALQDTRPEAPVVPLLHDIQTAALRAADLTKQMLAYSGKGRFVVENLDLNHVIEEMIHLLKVVINKQAVLKLNLAGNLPTVEADATQLRQVVMNLITNASDAIGDRSGVISITTGAVDVDKTYLGTTYLDEGLSEGDYVFVEVSDTGEGMDATTQARIFDPFFTTKFTGRGLGLAAVLGILRSHRGAVKVYSEIGRGSTFKVLLPCAPGSTRETLSSPSTPSIAAVGEGLILVCDDEETIRAIARRILQKAGFTVITASDGKEAVSCFRERSKEIRAVLLDMTMPGLSGEQVFHEMRRINPEVRVLLSSGYNEQDATSHFVGKGLAGFIQKPWSPNELVKALWNAVALKVGST
jgi:PAS domain S-box-containing protein